MSTRVKFTQGYSVQSAPEEGEPRAFEKDEVVDFMEEYADDPVPPGQDEETHRRARAEASANHFVKRGMAVRVDESGEVVQHHPARKRSNAAPQQQPARRDAAGQAKQEQTQQEQRAEPTHGRPGLEPSRAPLGSPQNPAPDPKKK